MDSELISLDEIHKSIQDSGYLIEQRVESVLQKAEYFVETNEAYIDDETGKSREIDIMAVKELDFIQDKPHSLSTCLLIECENNKPPIVFFRNNNRLENFLYEEEAKVSGLPVLVFPNQEVIPTRIHSFLDFHQFHHYCKGSIATQYCSFNQPKSKEKKWIAFHPEKQHETFQNLIKCLKYKIKEHYDSYFPLDRRNVWADIQLYYPVIVLQGDLYEAYIEKGELKVVPAKHIQFRKQSINGSYFETYQIDIVQESYLKKFLSIIDKETNEIAIRLKREIKTLKKSMQLINEQMEKHRDLESYRQILEGYFI